jgi:hypothetical protein
MKTSIGRKVTVAVFALAMLFGVGAQGAQAEGHTFDVSVYHGIDGSRLGLSQELPVDIYVYKDGEMLAFIPGFSFMDRIQVQLPAGEYEINVYSPELGAFVESMAVGPVEIPAGVDVRMNAQLGPGQTPVIRVKVNGENLPTRGTGYYQGESKTVVASEGTFAVSAYHGIDGRRIGLSEELPVDIYIYKNGELLARVADFTFMDRFSTELPAGSYEIKIYSQELGAFVDSMSVGPVDIPEGVGIRLSAQLGPGLTPVLVVNVK